MCGRTACTLAPDEICKSCRYPSSSNNGGKQGGGGGNIGNGNTGGGGNNGGKGYKVPQWRDHPSARISNHYTPSFNMAPSRFAPVMIMDQHNQGIKRDINGEVKNSERVIQPMMWGLIPHFYKGSSPTGHGLKTNNCRVESVVEKRLYGFPLKKGLRCVVLCDGFYEWQSKSDKTKQPYFIYAPQADEYPIWDRKSWPTQEITISEDGKYQGPEVLKMAGLYSKWTSDEGEEVMSYTILTMESGKKFGDLHHRIPAILDTEDKVQQWLDSNIGYEEALKILSKDTDIEWHPVSTLVNNSRNDDSSCPSPVDVNEKPPETAESKLMSSWLKSSKPSSQPKKSETTKTKSKQQGIQNWLNKSNKDESSA